MRDISKPEKGEYPEYAEMYIKLLPDDNLILKHLADNFRLVKDFIYALPPEKLLYRYAENKWTIKEILVHIIDDERIFSYRAPIREFPPTPSSFMPFSKVSPSAIPRKAFILRLSSRTGKSPKDADCPNTRLRNV